MPSTESTVTGGELYFGITLSLLQMKYGDVTEIKCKKDSFTVTVDTTNDLIQKTSHNIESNNLVRFTTTDTLPSPLQTDTDYIATNISTNDFQIKSKSTRQLIDITDTGTGTHTCVPQDVTYPVNITKNKFNSIEVVTDTTTINQTDLDNIVNNTIDPCCGNAHIRAILKLMVTNGWYADIDAAMTAWKAEVP